MWETLKDATRPTILDLMKDPDRAEAFSVRADGLLFDYSKTSMDGPARKTKPRPLASRQTACSVLRIGWAGATPCGGRSGCL